MADPQVQDNNQVNLDGDQGGQVVQQQVQAGSQTTLAFKVEQSKVPEYFGQKNKDRRSAVMFIQRIDDLARTNNWTDAVTYTIVANTLRGFARDWLFATVEMLDWEGDQLTWTNLKPRFQAQFATQTDDRLIIEGLSNLAMKPNKSTGELLTRIINTIMIIKENYAAYQNKVEAPHHDANRGYLDATATKWENDSVKNAL
jgi:hypothetical protein